MSLVKSKKLNCMSQVLTTDVNNSETVRFRVVCDRFTYTYVIDLSRDQERNTKNIRLSNVLGTSFGDYSVYNVKRQGVPGVGSSID